MAAPSSPAVPACAMRATGSNWTCPSACRRARAAKASGCAWSIPRRAAWHRPPAANSTWPTYALIRERWHANCGTLPRCLHLSEQGRSVAMNLRHTLISLGLALVVAPLAAQAQDPASAPIGLQVDGGSVLVSTGGEFVQATPGQVIQPGHRVMLSEGAKASLAYGNGCQKALSEPGVYTVSAECD